MYGHRVHYLYTLLSVLFLVFLCVFRFYPVLDAKFAFFAQGPDDIDYSSLLNENQNSYQSKLIIVDNEFFLLSKDYKGEESIDSDDLGFKVNNYSIFDNNKDGMNIFGSSDSGVYFLSKLNSDIQFKVILSNDYPIRVIPSPTLQHLLIETQIDDPSSTRYNNTKYVFLNSNDKGTTWHQVSSNLNVGRNFLNRTIPFFVNEQEVWLINRTHIIEDPELEELNRLFLSNNAGYNHHEIEQLFDSIYHANYFELNFTQIEPRNKNDFIANLKSLLEVNYPKKSIKNVEKSSMSEQENQILLYPLFDNTVLVWKRLPLIENNEESSITIQFKLKKENDFWIADDCTLLENEIINIRGYQDNIYASFKKASKASIDLAKLNTDNYKWDSLPSIPSIFGILSFDSLVLNDFDVTKNAILISTSQYKHFNDPLSTLGLKEPFYIYGVRIFYLLHNSEEWKALKTKSSNLGGTNKEKNIYYHNNKPLYSNDRKHVIDSYHLN